MMHRCLLLAILLTLTLLAGRAFADCNPCCPNVYYPVPQVMPPAPVVMIMPVGRYAPPPVMTFRLAPNGINMAPASNFTRWNVPYANMPPSGVVVYTPGYPYAYPGYVNANAN